MYSNKKEANDAGWFSRRHRDDKANRESRLTRRERLNLRKEEANERADIRALRSDEEQLEVLRQRGVTEGREVERLKKRIASV
jgi:hypothetical protein